MTMRILSRWLVAAGAALILGACGGDEETLGGNPVAGSGGAPETIQLTFSISDAIEDEGGGVYRRRATAVVNDREGNPVPDGTVVHFTAIDTVFAQGTIDGVTGTITGDTLSDSAPVDTEGAATDFTTTVKRRDNNGVVIATESLEAGDIVHLLTNTVDRDRVRRLSMMPGTTTVTLKGSYSQDYPVGSTTTNYIVGASTSSISIEGTTVDGDTVKGRSETVDGEADFSILYPAQQAFILTGCYDTSAGPVDTRTDPADAGRVFISATAGNNASAVTSDFCFAGIDNGSLNPFPKKLGAGSGQQVEITLRDGGAESPLPFVPITYRIQNDTGAPVQAITPARGTRTDRNGHLVFQVDVSGNPGDKATIQFLDSFGFAEATVDVEIPS